MIIWIPFIVSPTDCEYIKKSKCVKCHYNFGPLEQWKKRKISYFRSKIDSFRWSGVLSYLRHFNIALFYEEQKISFEIGGCWLTNLNFWIFPIFKAWDSKKHLWKHTLRTFFTEFSLENIQKQYEPVSTVATQNLKKNTSQICKNMPKNIGSEGKIWKKRSFDDIWSIQGSHSFLTFF